MKAKTLGQPIGMNGCQSVGHDDYGRFWYTTELNEYPATVWFGHHRGTPDDDVYRVIIQAGRERNAPYPLCGARPNVTGPRQTRCHDFPDIGPDDDETPVLIDVETPGTEENPVPTVETADKPRQESVPGLVWGAMAGNELISDLIRELQPHDRDDIRQDMALKYWRKAVRQELRGQRISNLTRWLTNDVLQWIGDRTDIATAGPLTKQQIEDANGDTLKLQRDQAEQSRLASLDHELSIEQARYAAEVEAKHRAAKPKAILAMQW